jgi:hypothetical protein
MNTAPATGETLLIIRVSSNVQGLDLIPNSNFDANSFEEQLDKIVAQVQELKEKINRSLVLKQTTSFGDLELPEPEASKFLGWNSAGTALENREGVSGEINNHADDTSTHGVLEVAGTEDIDTHASDTSTHGITSTIAGLSESQSFTNKTFEDDITLKEISTPSTPASGYALLYPKSDGILYQLNDSGTESVAGFFGEQSITCDTHSGFGSTDTKISGFTNVTTVGTHLVAATTAASGTTVTVQSSGAGVYAALTVSVETAEFNVGISVNSSNLTTAVSSLAASELPCGFQTQVANKSNQSSFIGYLAASDVLRVHCTGGTATSTSQWRFVVLRIA